MWLDRQYRALLVREGEILDQMLALTLLGRTQERQYAALTEELLAIGRHQSSLARLIGGPAAIALEGS